MSQIKLEIHPVGMLSTNCYFLINKETGECAVVDPGDNADGLEENLRRYLEVCFMVDKLSYY